MDIVTQNFGPGIVTPGNPISLNYLSLSKITAATNIIGTGSYTVEVTLDEIFNQNSADYVPVAVAGWYPVAGPVWPLTVDGYVTFDGPWRAIRLNPTANSTGIVFQVAQGDSGRY